MEHPIDIPDAPDIRNIMATGYPDERRRQEPHCPICGKPCETVYRDSIGYVFGCDLCIKESDAWEEPECFAEGYY